MLQKACGLCKVVGIIAILGTLNLGLAGLTGTNLAEQVLGGGVRIFNILVGLSGIMMLLSFFMVCPACKKS